MSVGARRPGGRCERRRRGTRVNESRLRPDDLVGVVEVVGSADRHDEPEQIGSARGPRQAQHGHERNDARTTAEQQRGNNAVPDEPTADRSAHLQLVADGGLVVQKRRHFATFEPLDGDLDLAGIGRGRRRDRVRARSGVSVGRGEPDYAMLTGAVRRGLGQREAKRLRARRFGFDGDHLRHLPRRAHSVALVPLFEPGVAPVVVPVLFPEARFVVVEQPEAGYELCALPEVEMRYE